MAQSSSTVGLLHPGEMGSAVGATVVAGGARVLWAPEGRGPATRTRAAELGLEDGGSLARLTAAAGVVISVTPPHAALAQARAVAALGLSRHLRGRQRGGARHLPRHRRGGGGRGRALRGRRHHRSRESEAGRRADLPVRARRRRGRAALRLRTHRRARADRAGGRGLRAQGGLCGLEQGQPGRCSPPSAPMPSRRAWTRRSSRSGRSPCPTCPPAPSAPFTTMRGRPGASWARWRRSRRPSRRLGFRGAFMRPPPIFTAGSRATRTPPPRPPSRRPPGVSWSGARQLPTRSAPGATDRTGHCSCARLKRSLHHALA